jgi:hypothetical protein
MASELTLYQFYDFHGLSFYVFITKISVKTFIYIYKQINEFWNLVICYKCQLVLSIYFILSQASIVCFDDVYLIKVYLEIENSKCHIYLIKVQILNLNLL